VSQVNLNENQQQAVKYTSGDLLIIAGAGTGKTAVITQRIIHLIKKAGVNPSEILALTFTEKAAAEMQERIDKEMEYGYEEPWISTFHSFCDRILREEGYNIGLDGGYSLMTTAQSYIFLRKFYHDLPLDTLRPRGQVTKTLNDILKHFSRLQDEDISPEDYVEFSRKLPKHTEEERADFSKYKELSETYKMYADLKMQESKVDFGDLIILTLKLFRERPNVLEKYRKKFKYILVDEFQDTNYTQNVLVNILTLGLDESKKSNKKQRPLLTVVGDDDQAIYKFRGAAISNILQFKETYPDAKEVVLTENYRSKQEILDASHTLISKNNPNRLEITENIDKKLIARTSFEASEGNVVNLIAAGNENAEAEQVVEEIAKLTGFGEYAAQVENAEIFDERGQSSFVEEGNKKNPYRFSDVAILVRANAHAEPFVQALRNMGIPYKLGGSRGLYFRPEIQNLIAFLKILVDYSDEISMYKLLAMSVWHLTPREYMDINRLAREDRLTLFEELEKLWNVKLGQEEATEVEEIKNSLIEKIFDAEAIAGITNLLMILDNSIKRIKDNRPITEVLYDFVKNSGYLDSFVNEETGDSLFAVSNIQKFFESIKRYEKDNPDTNVYEYVDFIDYCIEVGESPVVDQSELEDFNAVNILTVHGAKGLEFPVAFLVNLVAQRFPSRNMSDSIPIPEALIKEVIDGNMSQEESHIQEERRLFYVGATRAKEKLYLSAASFYGDAKTKKKPSIFLYEILDRDISDEFNFDKGKVSIEGYEEKESLSLVPMEVHIELMKNFSYSQLDTYELCPRKYEYAYVLRVPQRPNSALSFGTTIHNTLKDLYTLLKTSKEGIEGIVNEPTMEELLESYNKNWVRAGYDNSKHESMKKVQGEKILKKYYEKIYSNKEQPLNLEESFVMHLGESTFAGKIDRIDFVKEESGVKQVCIVDYKTGKVKSEADIKKDLQLPLYAIFVEEKLGYKVIGAQYIFVEEGVKIDVDISTKRREKAKERMIDIIDEIKKRDFHAEPDMFKCSMCDYRSVCEFAKI
jgi:DNA helicase II / ATP-dependent DNA helicase PcrA